MLKRKGNGFFIQSPKMTEEELRQHAEVHELAVLGDSQMIREFGGSYYVYSHDGKKRLAGPYKTKEEAVRRLQQIEVWKKRKGK